MGRGIPDLSPVILTLNFAFMSRYFLIHWLANGVLSSDILGYSKFLNLPEYRFINHGVVPSHQPLSLNIS
jgi:hypothetical protein